MKKILFLGYYGQKSFGDDLFLLSINHFFKNRNVKYEFFSKEIESLSKEHFVLKSNNPFYKIIKFLFIYHKYDAFVFAGGSTYKKKSGLSVRSIIDILIKKKNKIVFGAGVGPFVNEKSDYFFRNLLGSYNKIIVRDSSSASLINELSPIKSVDIVHNYVSNFKKTPCKNIENIAISFAHSNSFETELQFYSFICNFMCGNKEKNYKIFNFNVAKNLRDIMWVEKIFTYAQSIGVNVVILTIEEKSSLELLNAYSTCNYAFTSRLHAAICAYSLNIPQYCYAYSDKVINFMNDIGSDARLIDNNFYFVDSFTLDDEINSKCLSSYELLEELI